jgi:predicted nuclease of predicted toxin-antitoxin system
MKVLLDSCVSSKIGHELSNTGHDVEWVGDWDEDPGDDVILTHAFTYQQILITLDKDFGELAIVKRIPHHGIIRLVNISLKKQPPACIEIIK